MLPLSPLNGIGRRQRHWATLVALGPNYHVVAIKIGADIRRIGANHHEIPFGVDNFMTHVSVDQNHIPCCEGHQRPGFAT
ncbi:MAG: hypothetical protein GPOALKHO_001752 [Sodalis sp.]|nr:MAG: hypothetical protein GPOALKHO_001752 [Sodalis sp.]